MLSEVKTSCYEPLYTLTEAEKIIDLQRARKSRQKARLRTYFIKQRLCGLLFIVIGGLILITDNTAGMGAIICIVMGIGLIATHQTVMMFKH